MTKILYEIKTNYVNHREICFNMYIKQRSLTDITLPY